MCNAAKENGHSLMQVGNNFCCKRCGLPAAECATKPCKKPAHKK